MAIEESAGCRDGAPASQSGFMADKRRTAEFMDGLISAMHDPDSTLALNLQIAEQTLKCLLVGVMILPS